MLRKPLIDEALATTRLYLITPPAFDPGQFVTELEEALSGGDVACLQLRLKEVEDDAIRRATRVLKPIAQDRGVAFIMNDRPDLAAELDCDGVHVGEEDMPYAEARRLLGPDGIVGVTCGASRDRAITAAEAGADYVAFGAFFPSLTKTATKYHADPELIRDWSDTTVVPCCAIGGITQQNCGPLVEAGADFLGHRRDLVTQERPARGGRPVQRGFRPPRPRLHRVIGNCGRRPAERRAGSGRKSPRDPTARRKHKLYHAPAVRWGALQTLQQGGFDN